MTQRSILTGLWSHPDFQRLPLEAKLLFIYCWSNEHCNQAGMYRVSIATIAFETGLREESVTGLLTLLVPLDVEWFPDKEILWVKKFLKRQTHSPKFLQACAKCLMTMSDTELVKSFLEYNATLDIPYEHPIDTLSIPPRTDSKSRTKAGTTSDSEAVSATDRELYKPWVEVLQELAQFRPSPGFVQQVEEPYGHLDLEKEARRCVAWFKKRPIAVNRPQAVFVDWLATGRKLRQKAKDKRYLGGRLGHIVQS